MLQLSVQGLPVCMRREPVDPCRTVVQNHNDHHMSSVVGAQLLRSNIRWLLRMGTTLVHGASAAVKFRLHHKHWQTDNTDQKLTATHQQTLPGSAPPFSFTSALFFHIGCDVPAGSGYRHTHTLGTTRTTLPELILLQLKLVLLSAHWAGL